MSELLGEVFGELLGESDRRIFRGGHDQGNVQISMQDQKSVCVAVMICLPWFVC